MGEWVNGEKKGQGWMDGGVGLGRVEGTWLDGWGSGKRERGMDRAGWMGE